jgi:hypothetical protein
MKMLKMHQVMKTKRKPTVYRQKLRLKPAVNVVKVVVAEEEAVVLVVPAVDRDVVCQVVAAVEEDLADQDNNLMHEA